MSTAEELLAEWHGKIMPQSFNASFVALSYVVSLIGAVSTLELINRRTSIKGFFNHSAITMGGVAIWCMHYIGNRAIVIGDGQAIIQIAYSSGFTALSFFVPILVLLATFVTTGTDNEVQWRRVAVGGIMAGTAICGMHYIGNASISNYTCEYHVANIVGSAVISVAASTFALALFFVFRATWTASWWKRGICSVVLAGAVSGMHWCASTGTRYRMIRVNTGGTNLSRNATVVVVICLSVGACVVIGILAFTTNRMMKRSAQRAQNVVLSVAVFDQQGRLLVSPDGLLPSEKITDAFVGRSSTEQFTVQHPLFQWMFRASRNWSSIVPILTGMHHHLAHLPRKRGGDVGAGIGGGVGNLQLISDHGEHVPNYEMILCELFCTATEALATQLKAPLTSMGVLWDEILATGDSRNGRGVGTGTGAGTGSDAAHRRPLNKLDQLLNKDEAVVDGAELAEMGINMPKPPKAMRGGDGRGSLMFLVRRVDSARELGDFKAAGYRFAEIRHVSGIISSSMKINAANMEQKLHAMQTYARGTPLLEAGVHVAFFGVRARVGTFGFDVLADREARNLLPTAQMPFDYLEPWQRAFVRHLDRMTPDRVIRYLGGLKSLSPKESYFASQLVDAINTLRWSLSDPGIFDNAVLSADVVEAPCRRAPDADATAPSAAYMLTFCAVLDIHQPIKTEACELVPLSFFKVHQLVEPDSPHHLTFLRSLHREIHPILNSVPVDDKQRLAAAAAHGRFPSLYHRGDGRVTRGSTHRRGRSSTARVDVDGDADADADGNRTVSPRGSTKAGSTKELWTTSTSDLGTQPSSTTDLDAPAADDDVVLDPALVAPLPMKAFGGVMISQEITVNVQETDDKPRAADDSRRHSANPSRPESQRTAVAEKSPTSSVTPITPIRIIRGVRGTDHPADTGVVTNAAAAVEEDSMTYVDELFNMCVSRR